MCVLLEFKFLFSSSVPPIVIPPRPPGSPMSSNPSTPTHHRAPARYAQPDLMHVITNHTDVISNLESRLHELEKR